MLYAAASLDVLPQREQAIGSTYHGAKGSERGYRPSGTAPPRRFLRQDSFTPQQTVDIPKEERKLSRDGKQAFQRRNESGTNDNDCSTVGEILMQRT